MNKRLCMGLALAGMACGAASLAMAQPASPAAVESPANMTLWQSLAAGGSVMIVIGILSIITVALVFYDLSMLTVAKMFPRHFLEALNSKLELKNFKDVRSLCSRENNSALSRIVLAGLEQSSRDLNPQSVREAVEQRARMEIAALWQNINYFSDIVVVAPLLGLLGTVFGMIQAFRAVPLQSTGVKTSLLVAGISKAMVATAAGLIVAIAALIAYSYFRGKVQELTSQIELHSTNIIKKIVEG